MESTKKCHSIYTKEFLDALKKSDSNVSKSIMKSIAKLEGYENDRSTLPDGITVPELACGKMLSEVNRTIYSLEPKYKIRAFAHVTQQDGVKVYVWLWGGTHEAYSKIIHKAALDKDEKNSNQKYGEEIKSKITEMSSHLSKPKVSANMHEIREHNKGNKHNGKRKGKEPGH